MKTRALTVAVVTLLGMLLPGVTVATNLGNRQSARLKAGPLSNRLQSARLAAGKMDERAPDDTLQAAAKKPDSTPTEPQRIRRLSDDMRVRKTRRVVAGQ